MRFNTRAGVQEPRAVAAFAALAMLLSMIPVFFAPLTAWGAEEPGSNPVLSVAECGIDVLMVLDETGSIRNNGDEQAVRDAFNAFIGALDGTNSSVGLIEFSSTPEVSGTADPVPGSPNSARVITTSGYAAPSDPLLTGYTATYAGDGYTNWQEALWEAGDFGATRGYPDLLLFITDGDPNSIDSGTYGQYEGDKDLAAAPAIPYANTLKTNGVHMFGIGVGLPGAPSEGRLSSVTGPNKATLGSLDIATDDYILLSDADEIADALAKIADQLCNTTINITKYVAETPAYEFDGGTGGDGFEIASGWEFNVGLAENSGFDWVSGGEPPGLTNESGQVQFKYSLDNRGEKRDVTITETVKSGYTLLGGNCVITLEDFDPSTEVFGANGWTLTGVPDLATVDCDVYNSRIPESDPTRIIVEKITIGGNGDFEFDPSYNEPFSLKDGESNDSGDLRPGSYSVWESVPSGWDLVSATCESTDDGDQSTHDAIDLAVGETVTCTFVNKKDTPPPPPDDDSGTVRVVKKIVSGDSTATFEFKGDLSGVIGHDGDITMSVALDTPFTSQEVVPVGWQIRDISCVADGATFLAGTDTATMTVTEDGGEVICTFNNIQDQVAATTITVAPTTVASTLPFTGFDGGSAGLWEMLLVGLGALALVGSHALREDEDA